MRPSHAPEEELNYLESLKKGELKNWISKARKGNTSPLQITFRDTYPSTVISQYYFLSKNQDFEKRFEEAVEELLKFNNDEEDDSEYVKELEYIARI